MSTETQTLAAVIRARLLWSCAEILTGFIRPRKCCQLYSQRRKLIVLIVAHKGGKTTGDRAHRSTVDL